MSNEKFRCYACNWVLTKNGTDMRKNPDLRVQRCNCRNENCYEGNIYIIIESEEQSLIGRYFFPKIKDRVFTFEEAVRKYQRKEELIRLQDTTDVIELLDEKEMVELLVESDKIEGEARQVKKQEYRKKAVEAALERNQRKVEKLTKELERIEIEIEELKHSKKMISTREEAIEWVKKGGEYSDGQILKRN